MLMISRGNSANPQFPSVLGENPWFWAGVREAAPPDGSCALQGQPPVLIPTSHGPAQLSGTAVFGSVDHGGHSRLHRKSIRWDDECLFLWGALGFLHGSQDTCKSPFRTLIYTEVHGLQKVVFYRL